MGLRIQTNLPSISAQRVLGIQQQRMTHATQALASGSRIVTASDDAAGLSISEFLRGQIRGVAMARNNAFNAVSAIQISEGGLNELTNIAIRLRELGIQAASDNIGDKERSFLQEEARHLVEEADRIAKTTQFGDKKLLDGTGGKMTFHVGAFSGPENTISYTLDANATASELGLDKVSMNTKEDAREALERVDQALEKIGRLRANFGAVQSRINAAVSNLDIQYENLSAANSRIRDVDVARETAEMASAQVLQSAAIAVLSQANTFPSMALKLIG
ncbi:MAG: flagellin [Bdellovibrionaceae bacterium]|nr:flagellin [Pseudobdellovibrionaceae bacterium]MDW8189457.1 flagellin [Pseudobdellovibrionaceae bacterium]